MSFAALAWAGKCRPGSASRKLVLFALADRHNDEANGSYPSVAWIADFTDLNRKTVITCLQELEAAGFISDSGERRGDTRQIKLYRLHMETVPKVEQFQKRNSTENGAKESQKRDTDTVRTSTKKKDKPSSSRSRATFVLPAHIPGDEWQGFEDMRRRIGKPLTDYARGLAIKRLDRLAEDGWPPGTVLNHSTLNSYQGLFPPKDRDNGRSRTDSMAGNQPGEGLGRTARAAIRAFPDAERSAEARQA